MKLFASITGVKKSVFQELLVEGLHEFCYLYGTKCVKGADRQMRLFLAWSSYSGTYACASMATERSVELWQKLTDGLPEVSDECRNAVISAVFAGVYTFAVLQKQMIIDNLRNQCM